MSQKSHILIVDDNFINRQYFSMSLSKSGYVTTTAESGFEAIQAAKKQQFDVILMDIRMSDMDGYETTRHLRQLPQYDHVPILAVSAEPISEQNQTAFAGFLLKPASPTQLASAVEKFQSSSITPLMFNKVEALKYAYNDEDILDKLTSLFIKDLPVQLSTLSKYIQHKDFSACFDTIHKLKGSCKTCGAQYLDHQLDALTDLINNHEYNAIIDGHNDVIKAAEDFISLMKSS